MALTFILSKLFWFFLKPSNVLGLIGLLGLWRFLRSGGRLGRICIAMVCLTGLLIIVLPVPAWLTTVLEERFPKPETLPDEVTGIIVLGGPQDPDVQAARDRLAVSESVERMIEGVGLALRYPDAKLVFTGRSSSIFSPSDIESDVNRRFLELLAFDQSRVIMEERSRNTFENAVFSKELLDPQDGEHWLLVTSAAHMPRSVGIFRQVGWPVIPYPVDYQTVGYTLINDDLAIGDSLDDLDVIAREWVGLLAYYIMGRTDALLPSP